MKDIYLTLVFKAESLSEEERSSLVEKCSAASWSHAIDERKDLEAEVELLRGITPEIPPYSRTGEGLPRYGVRWNGPTQPLAVSMEDGYWTPWHLADELVRECQRLHAANLDSVAVCEQALQAKTAAEQERDQLKHKLFSLSDVCDAVFEWVDSVPAETILPTMPGFDRDWADQLRQQAKEVRS